jgi:hypothetical protein
MALKGKMQRYAEARAQGLSPTAAAALADYSGSGARVTVSRIEARADVQAEIRRLKKGERVGDKPEVEDDSGEDTDPWKMKAKYPSSLALLQDLYNNAKAPKSLRYQAAKDALPYEHPRKEAGKKEEVEKAAKAASAGKFRTTSKPGMRLVSSR